VRISGRKGALSPALRLLVAGLLVLPIGYLLFVEAGAVGIGLPTQTWPAGQHLASIAQGGRIATFHRGVLMLAAEQEAASNGLHYYNISNPLSPTHLGTVNAAENGHMWWKFGDMFFQEYFQPQLTPNSQFQDLSVLPQTKAWTSATPLKNPTNIGWHSLSTFPLLDEGTRLSDQRTGLVLNSNVNLAQMAGGPGGFEFRIGNLLFFAAGDQDPQGISVIDVGDPANPVFLSKIVSPLQEYTNFAV